MIIVNDTPLNATISDIVSELHEEFPDKLGIVKDTTDNLMVQCPFHSNGQEKKPSCGINKHSGVFNCFACGEKGDIAEFVSKMYGRDDYGLFGLKWLRDHFTPISIEERPDLEIDTNRKQLKKVNYSYVTDMVLEQYRWVHPYMYERKLTDEVIELFDVGYDPETDMVTFPVRDIYGNCLFVARRSVKGKYFHYPFGAEKPLYGVYEISELPYWVREIWVTESMFNCLTLWTHGIPAVALNGTGSKYQLEELSKLNCRSLVIALDPDAAGRSGTQKIRNFLKDSHKILYTVQYKDGRDINDLSYEECEQLINSKILL